MKKEYKQVNYKLPPDVVEALNTKAKEEGTTATNLVLRGLEHVLGISSKAETQSIDSNLYESIRAIEIRLESLEAHSIEKEIYNRISSLENYWNQFTSENIENNIYGRIARLEQLVEAFQQNSIDFRIDTHIDSNLDNDKSPVEEHIDSRIDESLEQENTSEEQIEVSEGSSHSESLAPVELEHLCSEEEEEEPQIMTTSEVVKLQPGLREQTLLMRRHRKKLPTNVGNYIVDFYDRSSKGKGREVLWSVRAMQKSFPSVP